MPQQLDEKYQAFFASCRVVASEAASSAPQMISPEQNVPAAEPVFQPVAAASIAFPTQFGRDRTSPDSGRTSKARREALLPLIGKVAQEYGIDAHLLAAIVRVESGFSSGAVSPKGALGLMQIMPATGRQYGISDSARLLTDSDANLRVGARYLRDLFRLFDDRLELVLAAYNAGEEAVRRHDNRVPPYRETQAYVTSVLKAYKSTAAARDATRYPD